MSAVAAYVIAAHASPMIWQCATLCVVAVATAALVCSTISRRRIRKALEWNLRDKARLRTLLEQMPCILWTTDKDLRITSSDGAGLAAVGLKPSQVVGLTLQEYFKTDDRTYTPLAIHYDALAGRSGNYYIHYKERVYLVHCEPLRERDGEIVGVIVAALDITVSKQAEQNLARSEAKNRALLTAIPDVMFNMTRGGRIIEFVDKLMAPADYFGKTVLDLFPETVAQQFLAAVNRAQDTQRAQVVEYETGGPGDDQRFFEARVVRCSDDDFLVILRNITERKRAENDLRCREAQLRSLIKAVPDLLFQFTRDGRFAGCVAPNPDDLYRPIDQLLGRTLYEILPTPVAALFSKHLRAAVETGQMQVCQYPLEIQGESRWFEARIVFTGDETGEVIAVVRNITDARERSYLSASAST